MLFVNCQLLIDPRSLITKPYSMNTFTTPTIFIVFGATGDLMRKKIIPALLYLYRQQHLPVMFQVIAFGRRPWTDQEYCQFALEALAEYGGVTDSATVKDFLTKFRYYQGTFESLVDYEGLAKQLGMIDGEWRACSNKLFYLSVPPQHYQQILVNLKTSKLTEPCSDETGWTRVLIEKPFGDDLATARALDEQLAELFKEEQIYRIDHYLAKEMLQNILAFRFSNNLFEQTWNNQFIERIEVRLLESIGVEDRGSFYDGVGALRDVGQNHLLQMLALITLDHPQSFAASAIRAKRAEAIRQLEIMDEAAVSQRSFRAQYEGYRAIKGVAADSSTETYFKLSTHLTTPRWQGVPVTLEAGKRMGKALKEIVVTFRHPMPCLCPPDQEEHYKNQIVFQLDPQEGIQIHFWAKKPGFDLAMESRSLDFTLHDHQLQGQYVEEYAKLVLDAICGDQTLFVSTEEVAAMWQVIDPIVKAWQSGMAPLERYQPDSATITEQAEAFLASHPNNHPTIKLSNHQTNPSVGIVGLGKMGANVARRLLEQGWPVVGNNRSADDIKALEAEGMRGAYSLTELVDDLPPGHRLIWLMLPAGEAIDQTLFDSHQGIAHRLVPGDIVIDAGNSFYKDSIRRASRLAESGIEYVDVGFSGGPAGARHGGCLMIGGRQAIFQKLEPLFAALSLDDQGNGPGYQFFEGIGAGHFIKMIHNGIEYGMMQAIAEGFAILKAGPYQLDLKKVAEIYNRGSVIESRLIGWLQSGLKAHGQDLADVSGIVGHTGEGAWTVQTAKELGIETKIIEGALEFRQLSERNPSYTGQILSVLREQFGGHSSK